MIKNFIMKHIIKPKNERDTVSHDELISIIGVLIVPLFITLYIVVLGVYDAYDTYEMESREDLCRVRGAIINDDYSATYLCGSEKIGEDKYMLIHEDESERLKENGYYGRPVIVYKDGRVK